MARPGPERRPRPPLARPPGCSHRGPGGGGGAAAGVGAVEPLNRVRRITAERMAASARSVARVTLLMEVDMTEAVRFRGQLATEFERRQGARLSYDAMIARASAIALGEYPTSTPSGRRAPTASRPACGARPRSTLASP